MRPEVRIRLHSDPHTIVELPENEAARLQNQGLVIYDQRTFTIDPADDVVPVKSTKPARKAPFKPAPEPEPEYVDEDEELEDEDDEDDEDDTDEDDADLDEDDEPTPTPVRKAPAKAPAKAPRVVNKAVRTPRKR